MPKLMITLKLQPGEAELETVRRRLNLKSTDVDVDFGVVSIDPQQNLYTILVDEEAAHALSQNTDVHGPYANPRIEPLGPPKKT